jgi:hypothetical protein
MNKNQQTWLWFSAIVSFAVGFILLVVTVSVAVAVLLLT